MSLHYITQQREIGDGFQKWVSRLIGFDFEKQYKPGAANRVADALSRKTVGAVELGALVTTQVVDWELLEDEITQDSFLNQLRQELGQKVKPHVGFTLTANRLLYKGPVVIPKSSSYISPLLYKYHDAPLGGHSGEVKTYLRMTAEWYWVGMRPDVARYVQCCTL